ncbi:CGNR zinc finger domain-containing protein [Streptomyces sp. NPDC090022]|uniref:CGNR zinc finger domain-containing protein n=1 Tax=Streptomyces sp. NPDC090022 TaxID=3365920 RepID=UPI0038072AEC
MGLTSRTPTEAAPPDPAPGAVAVAGTAGAARARAADGPEGGGDPRPLTGEPLCLDLLNTRWHDRHGHHDLLAGTDGLARWLAGSRAAHRYRDGDLRADAATLAVARQARSALAVVAGRRPPDPPDPAALDAFNRLLEPGRIRRLLTPAGPVERTDVADPARLLGWLAAADYLTLLAGDPGRIRTCADPSCGLYFLDTSRNGSRRWCAGAGTGCGNRAKAARHYARRTRSAPLPHPSA